MGASCRPEKDGDHHAGLTVIARSVSDEAIQLRALEEQLDCFAALAMTLSDAAGTAQPARANALAAILAPVAMNDRGRFSHGALG
jgi:hypothetical protein